MMYAHPVRVRYYREVLWHGVGGGRLLRGLHQVLIAAGALLLCDRTTALGVSVRVIAGSTDNNSSPHQTLQADLSARGKRHGAVFRVESTYILATISTVDDLNSSDILDQTQVYLPPSGTMIVRLCAGATPPAPIKAVPVDRLCGISIKRHR